MYRTLTDRFARIVAITFAFTFATAAAADKPQYPATRVEDVVESLHGVEIHDPYRWLEEEESPAAKEWIASQNAFTRAYLDRHKADRDQIVARLGELYSAGSVTSPLIFERRFFYLKREGKQNQPILYVKRGSMDEKPKVAIDPNKFSDDGTVALDWWYPSPDGAWILYGRSSGGDERSTLYLRDVEGGFDTALVIPNTRYSSIAWDRDAQGFHYTRYPEAGTVAKGDENYFKHLYYHKMGTDWKNDPKIFGDGRPKEEFVNISNSDDSKWQFMTTSTDWARNDLYIRKAGQEEFTPVAVGLDGLFDAEVVGEKLLLRTNLDAPRYRIVAADVNNPSQGSWKDLVSEGEGVIESMTVAKDALILSILENASSRLRVYDLDGKHLKDVELPTLGTVSGVSSRCDRTDFYFAFASYAYPPTVYRVDLKTFERAEVDRVEAGIDAEKYETRQVWYKSRDGTNVPMFIIHKKGVSLDGNNPTILYGYGGFNISMTPRFDPKLFVWLERGGVYAIANLRGGGEFGKDWHAAGRLEKKQNVFDDMIAAAEKLIVDRYTSPARLGIAGGSNGGLLMGAMMTQRPELFKAVHCAVPLLDMLRYHKFSIARLWIPEYGSADDPAQFKWLHAYSPYHHVKKGEKYPATFFTTAESDSRVNALHAMKMTARVQAATASDDPILLWVETKAGHGAGKPVAKQVESAADVWLFFMIQLGMIGK